MTVSPIFSSDRYKEIGKQVVHTINREEDFVSARSAGSTRAVGDAIQDLLCDRFQTILGDLCADYSADFARRAMADLAFTDCDGFYYRVDVKTHRLGLGFSMPNLTSVERLVRFYEDDRNYFVVLVVAYEISGTRVIARQAHFLPIEFLSWDCLTVGALGWGQIQIANANRIEISPERSRREWMIQLCDTMLGFYPNEIEKIQSRIRYFEDARKRWIDRL